MVIPPNEAHVVGAQEAGVLYLRAFRKHLCTLLGVKIVHLVYKTDLFKISNLVYGGREIVRSLNSSLQGQ